MPTAITWATYLLLVGEEELEWVNTIRNGTSEDRKPVKNERRLVGLLEQQLLQNIENNGEQDKGGEAGGDEDRAGRIRGESPQWASNVSEYTHG